MNKLLEVKNLSSTRGGRELFKDINFSLNSGEALHIVGRNGAGKSTLASIIAGDLAPTDGEVLINGSSRHTTSELSHLRGVLTQTLEINFPITVREFVEMGAKNSTADDALASVKISDLEEKKVTELSQGQLQRALIAQLLLQDPAILILDEPFSAQDAENTGLIVELFKNLKAKGKALIIINHIDIDLGDLVDKQIALS